jgi:hypothetical protein
MSAAPSVVLRDALNPVYARQGLVGLSRSINPEHEGAAPGLFRDRFGKIVIVTSERKDG